MSNNKGLLHILKAARWPLAQLILILHQWKKCQKFKWFLKASEAKNRVQRRRWNPTKADPEGEVNVIMLPSGKEENKVTDVIPCLLSRKRSLGVWERFSSTDTETLMRTQIHPSFHHLPSFKATYHIWKSELGLDGRPTFMLRGDSDNHSGGWRVAAAAHLSNCDAGVRRQRRKKLTWAWFSVNAGLQPSDSREHPWKTV